MHLLQQQQTNDRRCLNPSFWGDAAESCNSFKQQTRHAGKPACLRAAPQSAPAAQGCWKRPFLHGTTAPCPPGPRLHFSFSRFPLKFGSRVHRFLQHHKSRPSQQHLRARFCLLRGRRSLLLPPVRRDDCSSIRRGPEARALPLTAMGTPSPRVFYNQHRTVLPSRWHDAVTLS